jgi:inosine/xanthosine triphosphate pyrophosphatase family protein
MIDSLTYVTSNPGKARQLNHYLDVPVLHKNIDLIEIQSLDVATIIEYKAKEAHKHVLSPVLVEDTSLQFFALRGRKRHCISSRFYRKRTSAKICTLCLDRV